MFKPLGDKVVIEVRQQEEKTAGGIVLPQKAQDKPMQGTVVAVGKGKFENGQLIPMEVKTGDVVLYSKYAGTEVEKDGKKYLIVKQSDILAVVDEAKTGNLQEEKELIANA
ncbi:MAG TPA: co-chaperone GroES [Bacillales bacterium]|nr:co-chaperone GroES [Bacillales bacterium]